MKVHYASITNVIANREIIPEFLQGRATPKNLRDAAAPFLRGGPERDAIIEELRRIRDSLGGPGASERTVRIILEEIEKSRGKAGAAGAPAAPSEESPEEKRRPKPLRKTPETLL